MRRTGEQAPDATLHARPREPVRLHDHLGGGPVVLLFFPFSFSSTCTEELCTVAAVYDVYRELDARVLGITVDSPYVTRRFAEAYDLPFPVLSDFNREAMLAYGVRRAELNGLRDVHERSVFVIDPDGVIVYAWMDRDPDALPPFEAIEAAVRAASG